MAENPHHGHGHGHGHGGQMTPEQQKQMIEQEIKLNLNDLKNNISVASKDELIFRIEKLKEMVAERNRICKANKKNATQSLHKETPNWWYVFSLCATIKATQR